MNFLNKKTPDILDCIADLSNDEIKTLDNAKEFLNN